MTVRKWNFQMRKEYKKQRAMTFSDLVEPSDASGNVRLHFVGRHDNSIGHRRLVGRNTIVDAVNAFDKLVIHVFVNETKLGLIRYRVAQNLFQHILAIVLVHEAGRRQLDRFAGTKDFEKSALMVIQALSGGVVLASHIDDNVAFGQHGFVAAADHGGILRVEMSFTLPKKARQRRT